MEKKWKMEKKNNGENSGPLTSLQVDRLTATDCNAAARANNWILRVKCARDLLSGFSVFIIFDTIGRCCTRSPLGGRLATMLVDRYFHNFFLFCHTQAQLGTQADLSYC